VDGDCDTAIVRISVVSVDDFPVANVDYAEAKSGALLHGSLTTNDILSGDGGNVSAKLTNPSHGMVTVMADGSFDYISNVGFIGTDSFVYQLCDADNDCDTAIVKINIFKKNEIPIAVIDKFSTLEDTPLTANVALNDTLSNDGINTWQLFKTPKHGTASISVTGELKYIPDANYNGTDSLWYNVCDPDKDCTSGLVTIWVISVNEQPLAKADYLTINEDTPGSGNVSGNDILSPDGGNGWSIIGKPTHGGVTMSLNGIFTYTPDPDFNGNDSFVYHLCDVDHDCDTAVVKITVLPVNDKPVANSDSYSVPEDTPLYAFLGFNDALSGDGGNNWSVITLPSNGKVNVNKDGTFNYMPAINYNGGDSFVVQLCDIDGNCDTSLVKIVVTPVNDPPFVVTELPDRNVNADRTLTITIIAADPDTGDKLTTVVTKDDGSALPSFITWTGNTLTAKPLQRDAGCYNIMVKVTDASGAFTAEVFKLCVVMDPVGIIDRVDAIGVKIYPNPTPGKVNIEFGRMLKSKVHLQVSNLAGQVIIKRELFDIQTTIDLTNKVKGIYFFRITTDSSEYIYRIVLY
jgi:hypothetical protein